MAGKGGYQRPNNPAPVSGPGMYSQRTDGGPMDNKQPSRYISGMPWGEAGEMNNLANAAPMSQAQSAVDVPKLNLNDIPMPSGMVPLNAPTQRPDEPITSGMPFGPGANYLQEEVTPLFNPETDIDAVAIAIRRAYAQYPSPELKILVDKLDMEGR
jgi:hypothetical protein